MKLAILTPTYNRVGLLEKLYQSLRNQTNHSFVWVVVNDGSQDDTDIFMNRVKKENDLFEIRYIKQDNGGKGRAINVALDNVMDTVFAIIIDDDEVLYENAVDLIIPYIDNYENTCCGGIEFMRDDKSGKSLGNYKRSDFFMSIQSRKRCNYYIDGYTGYFIGKIKKMRAPMFANEKYIGPGVLQTLVSNRYGLLWPNVSIGTTEYLEDGLTRQGRPLRLKNPKGMIYYSILMQHKESGLFLNFAYSVLGYAYFLYSHHSKKDLYREGIDISKLNSIGYIPGLIISLYWKLRY